MTTKTGQFCQLHLRVTREELECMDAIRPVIFRENPYLALKLERAILSVHNRFKQKDGEPKRIMPVFPAEQIRKTLSQK